MAEKMIEKLKEQLNCAVCLDTYTDPKLLQCFHVYCRECLVRLVVRDQQGQLVISCPCCRQATPVPANGVAGLQSAFQLNTLLEIMEGYKMKGPSAIYENIGTQRETSEDNVAIELTCPRPLPPLPPPCCGLHSDKELELYCETCGELICSHCVFRGQKHHSHEYDVVGLCFDRFKGEVIPSLETLEKQLTTVERALKQLDDNSVTISEERTAIEENIHRTVDHLHQILDTRRTELINQLHQITQKRLKRLAVQRDEVETTQAQLSSCLNFIKQSLDTHRHGEILKVKTTVMSQLKKLTAPLEFDVLTPKEARVEFIVSPNVTTMCQNYGHIISRSEPDISQCIASGEGLKTAMVGEESTISIQMKDFKGKPYRRPIESLQCELVSEVTGATVREACIKRGKDWVSYQPTHRGRHQLLIEVNGQHIKGSPFPIMVELPIPKLGVPISTIHDMNGPWLVAFNADRREAVVTEHNSHCIKILSLHGKVRSFGTLGSDKGQFNYPCGVAVDGEGNIYVADTLNHRIQKFTADGRFLAAVGSKGNGPQHFEFPKGIAFNFAKNKVFVADDFNCRIQVLNSNLDFSGHFGKKGTSKGKLNRPWGVACDSSGNVYVADSDNHAIQVFTADGKILKRFGKSGRGVGQLSWPVGIAVDANDYVYVSDFENNRISVFTSDGQFVTSFGQGGSGLGEFRNPRGVTIDNKSGVLYVCDHDNNRIQIF